MENKKSVGRPSLYGEPTKKKTFVIPISQINQSEALVKGFLNRIEVTSNKITPNKKARLILTDFLDICNNFDIGKKCALLHVETLIDLLSVKKSNEKKLGFYLVVRYELEKINTPF